MKLTIQSIVDTARFLVEEEGLESLNLQSLTEKLGVKAPTFITVSIRFAKFGDWLRFRHRRIGIFAKSHPDLYWAMLALTHDSGRARGSSVNDANRLSGSRTIWLGEAGIIHFARAFRRALYCFETHETDVSFALLVGALIASLPAYDWGRSPLCRYFDYLFYCFPAVAAASSRTTIIPTMAMGT